MVDWLKAEIERIEGVFCLKAPVAAVELVEGEEEDEGSVKSNVQVLCPYTLLTLPLGVLRYAPPTFTPPLSIRRQQAIQRLDDDPTRLLGPTGGRAPSQVTANTTDPTAPAKGAFPPRTPEWLEQNPQALMAFDLHAQCGIPALCVFVAGEFGDVAETCTDAQTTKWVTGVVQQWLGGLMKKPTDRGDSTNTEGSGVPRPVEVLRTAWRKDEHAFGSYAYIPVGNEGETPSASPLDQVELTRTMWDR
ncbi:hypothetical protein M408DRAFT_30156 [Serendipita vermifera MAFF 305830]|uniref:Amine oxidase domain-containing protein n=1 Tax=Serendipita vermifera MAFF 305830 TaxID=933852 RepID=A0A0C2W2K6_SERVB|nr:hypothetical protein M408DRAFT_30156 [Serendipita vermifera MAFF 305830]